MAQDSNKSLSLLVIGDPHFKLTNTGQISAMTEAIIKLVRERRPQAVICLGDVLDRHAHIHVDPLCMAIDFFRQLKKYVPVYILIGNHDRRNNRDFLSDRHPFTAMKEWTGVYIVDHILEQNINGHQLVFVPYVPKGRFVEALDTYSPYYDIKENKSEAFNTRVDYGDQDVEDENIDNQMENKNIDNNTESNTTDNTVINPATILSTIPYKEKPIDKDEDYSNKWWWKAACIFPHQEFKGSKLGAIISEDGDKWPITGPMIFSGHIHGYQKVQENVVHVGTPVQHNHGDKDDKTVSLICLQPQSTADDPPPTQLNNAQYIYNGWWEERIDLGLIKRKTFHLTATQLLSWTPPTDCLVKVVVQAKPGELKSMAASTQIKRLRAQGITVTINTIPDKQLQTGFINRTQTWHYLDSLRHIITADSKQLDWFNKIFSDHLAGIGNQSANNGPTIIFNF